MRMVQPIENIVWIDPYELTANDYNPNVVFDQEMKLLEFSLLATGWIQPILATREKVIIDGFHRTTIARLSEKVRALGEGKVPVALLDITEAERKLLTIRINRAKGSHVAVKMSDIIKSLIEEHEMSKEYIAKSIGGTKAEIDLLLQDDVFKKHDIANHKYSKAWYPKYD